MLFILFSIWNSQLGVLSHTFPRWFLDGGLQRGLVLSGAIYFIFTIYLLFSCFWTDCVCFRSPLPVYFLLNNSTMQLHRFQLNRFSRRGEPSTLWVTLTQSRYRFNRIESHTKITYKSQKILPLALLYKLKSTRPLWRHGGHSRACGPRRTGWPNE